jgi:predicted dehydrogenase
MTAPVRWAILGTAGIARGAFLPALAEAGGIAQLVAGRDRQRSQEFAQATGIAAGVEGYAAALADPLVDAVYIALPNSLHAEWTIAALAAGKTVLCEKPLCVSASEAASVLAVAAAADVPLWEAFVFPFQPQFLRVRELLAEGAIGELREISSGYHFRVSRADDIRMSRTLGGGAFADVGCYPLRLAQLLFDAAPTRVQASAVRESAGGVEVDAAALLDYSDGRRLTLTCGFRRDTDTGTRLMGTRGVIELTNPFHPKPFDTVTIRRNGLEPIVERPTFDTYPFTAALRHVGSVVRGEVAPIHLAIADSYPTAETLDRLREHSS